MKTRPPVCRPTEASCSSLTARASKIPASERLVLATLLFAACHHATPPGSLSADASGLVPLSLRVPAALTVQRGIDTLSVAVDPATLGLTQLMVDAGMITGVETQTLVFGKGRARPALERRAVAPGVDFNAGATTWTARKDGIPERGTEYVVEMQLVLFETDAPLSSACFANSRPSPRFAPVTKTTAPSIFIILPFA